MKKIKLGKREVYTVIDDDDYDYLMQWNWYLSHDGYAYRSIYSPKLQRATHNIRMHRQLLQPKGKEQVDHINHDRLDNRRMNLRLCTHNQNLYNKPAYGKSGVKGVRFYEPLKKWQARFQHKHLGYFEEIDEAAKAYNQAALSHYGDFAYINEVKEAK